MRENRHEEVSEQADVLSLAIADQAPSPPAPLPQGGEGGIFFTINAPCLGQQ